jgi:REP element-mobilizing transposase RayT
VRTGPSLAVSPREGLPIVAGHHLIWTVYGWWLPNDPRGSTSHEIRSASIASLGEIHYGRKRIQPSGRVMREFHDAARQVLKHPLLEISADEIRKHNYTCYACAILPDHVHLVIRKHRDQAETMIEHLQDASRTAVQREGVRSTDHPVWGGPGWKVFLDSREDLERAIAYVRKNLRGPQAGQSWPFVKPYNGWLPGQVRVVRRVSQ